MASIQSTRRLSPSERVWRRVLLDPNARAASFAIDVSTRPVEVTMVGRRPIEGARIAAFVALWVMSSLFMLNAVVEGLVGMGLISGFLFLAVGIMGWVVWAASRMEWHASWLADQVRVRDIRWGKTHEWSTPYREFEGITVRKLSIGQNSVGGIRLPVTYHLAELRHADPLKTVLIASSRDPAEAERAARIAAQALGMAVQT